MPLQVLNIPIDSKEVKELIGIFQLKRQAEKYQNAMLRHMKEHWGEDLGEEQDGYIDGTVDVVEDGKLVFPFKDLDSEQLKSYISEKVGDFSIYARLWNSTPSEYEIDIPLNIGTTQDEYWVDLSLGSGLIARTVRLRRERRLKERRLGTCRSVLRRASNP